MRFCRIVAAALIGVALAASARAADPDALWKIVHGLCVPDQQLHADPAPCAQVDLGHGEAAGYAVLKDISGATQFLLIPTARLTGIESPPVRADDAPNYFAAAWRARLFIDRLLKQKLPRDAVALAINSRLARSQQQFHIHIDCVRTDVRAILHDRQGEIGERWAAFDPKLAGRRYRAMRVTGEDLDAVNPFALLAEGMPDAPSAMGQHTLVAVGATFADGRPGFILLDDRVDLAAGDSGAGETLQDHACAVARDASTNG